MHNRGALVWRAGVPACNEVRNAPATAHSHAGARTSLAVAVWQCSCDQSPISVHRKVRKKQKNKNDGHGMPWLVFRTEFGLEIIERNPQPAVLYKRVDLKPFLQYQGRKTRRHGYGCCLHDEKGKRHAVFWFFFWFFLGGFLTSRSASGLKASRSTLGRAAVDVIFGATYV